MNKAPKDDAPMLEWALYYASLGWAVFPIKPREKAAFYSYPEYKNPENGNTHSWQHQATKDKMRIEIFWSEHPDANIGVATGPASDLYVLDLDIEKPGSTQDGRKHFIEWQKKSKAKGNVENTLVSVTGSGGNQIFFTNDKPLCKTGAQIYKGYGVDTRGDGGYCVLPPSIHPNGERYQWKNSPTKYKAQKPNVTMIEYMAGLPAPEHEPIVYDKGYELPEKITEGGRTDELIRYTGQIIAKNPNITDEQAKDLIRAANSARCTPPLDERDLVKQVFPSIQRFKNRQTEPEPKKIDPAEYMKQTAANYIDDFWSDPANLKAPIPTGYSLLDRQLDGGLYTGLYVIGALSTMGKTTFTLQMANQMAQAGNDILFFSLEMSRAELIAKSISNLTAVIEAGYIGDSVAEAIGKGALRNAKTARALTDPERIKHFNEDEKALIIAAKELYKRQYGGRIWIIEGEEDIGAAEIRDRVKQHIEITGKTPIVFVDYLQILRSGDPRLTDKQRIDENVVALRRLARANNTVVFAISSLNRSSYTKDIDMDAFKESGAIEYSSDGLLGLQPRNMDNTTEKSDLIKDTKRAQVRQLELRILKNRGGLADGTQQFYYTPAFNAFEDVINEPTPPKQTKPRKAQNKPNMTMINDKMNALLLKNGIPWPSEHVLPDDYNPFEN